MTRRRRSAVGSTIMRTMAALAAGFGLGKMAGKIGMAGKVVKAAAKGPKE
jgi:hypothetical protein